MANKKRWLYFFLIVVTVPAGLGTRSNWPYLPNLVAIYGGDVLSATCIFFGIRFLFAKYSLLKISVITYLVCIAIETFQLYQAPWIQKIRHTPPFGILLGFGFLWSDWVCYLVGTLLGFAIAFVLEEKLLKNWVLQK